MWLLVQSLIWLEKILLDEIDLRLLLIYAFYSSNVDILPYRRLSS